MNRNKKYQDLAKEAFGYVDGSEYFENQKVEFIQDDFGNSLVDIDFSEITGKNFKRNLSKINRKLNTKVIASDNRKVGKNIMLIAETHKKLEKLLCPMIEK